jgi:hypothetical protein
MRGIKSKIYPRERGIHAFQAPLTIQKHEDDKNPRDEFLLADLGYSLGLELVHSRRKDCNKCTSIPFVYQSTLLEYYELTKDGKWMITIILVF